jgi:hypothetical protein
MMNWKGFGNKQSWPNQGTIAAFASVPEENHENIQSVRITIILVTI